MKGKYDFISFHGSKQYQCNKLQCALCRIPRDVDMFLNVTREDSSIGITRHITMLNRIEAKYETKFEKK